jgi:hypothetical protein
MINNNIRSKQINMELNMISIYTATCFDLIELSPGWLLEHIEEECILHCGSTHTATCFDLIGSSSGRLLEHIILKISLMMTLRIWSKHVTV